MNYSRLVGAGASALLGRGLRPATGSANETIASTPTAGPSAKGSAPMGLLLSQPHRLGSKALALVSSSSSYADGDGDGDGQLTAATSPPAPEESSSDFADWWHEYWSRQPFPSGYTQSSITLLACLITIIIFLIVVGNCLVCIAIFTEKSLKPTQNWFIASLAVSDMLLGLVVMPFSLARELMGFWVFGPLWCDIHEAVDVLLTTASINTLCLISLDRYWSITQAVSYLKKRTPRRGALMIAFVWVFSAAVSLPPLFGWKKQSAPVSGPPAPNGTAASGSGRGGHQQSASTSSDELAELEVAERDQEQVGEQQADEAQQQWRRRRRRRRQEGGERQRPVDLKQRPSISTISTTAGALGAADELAAEERRDFYANLMLPQRQHSPPGSVLTNAQAALTTPGPDQLAANEYPTCQLSDDIGYVLYSAFGSFFIPCGVMVFTYIKIFLAARSRARRAINKQSRAYGANRAKAAGGGGKQPPAEHQQQQQAQQQQHQQLRKTIAGTTSGARAGRQLGHAASSAQLERPLPAGELAQQVGAAAAAAAVARRKHSAVMRGSKLVVVDRRKSSTAAPPCGQQPCTGSKEQVLDEESEGGGGGGTCATLTTSDAQLATASALQPSEGRRKSSLITVMSESMAEVPVTRFNFNKPALDAEAEAEAEAEARGELRKPAPGPEADAEGIAGATTAPGDKQKVAALLKAISQASDHVEENLIREILDVDAEAARGGQGQARASSEAPEREGPPASAAPMQSQSTNETCFMTIEEDSDNLEAQTGRTIMIVASNARSPLPNAAKSQAITMTMLPAAGDQSSASTPPGVADSPGAICNNVACLRRQRQRQRQRPRNARASPSYCGSSMTMNDDDDDDEADEGADEEEGDEEEEEEEEEEAADEEDECLDDDLLTDDCNGYSNSCPLDQECALRTCLECAALQAKAGQGGPLNSDSCHDSPGGCQFSAHGDSPRIFASAAGRHKLAHRHQSETTLDSQEQAPVCNHQQQQQQQLTPLKRFGQQQQQRMIGEQSRENESLTGEDNLSLTDYRSQDENSSILGHDVLDATPAPERSHSADKRRSIVASALASVAGAAGRSAEQAAERAGAGGQLGGRKKSSIGFRLARLGSSAPAPHSNQAGGAGNLLALAARSQQQAQLTGPSPNQSNPPSTTRNLKTLRQNFFHKLNQLTAKSAIKQSQTKALSKTRSPNGKSSAQSSYGSSYEPSIDYATTSNVHSNNDQPAETTFGETDDYEQQTSGETRQSSGLESAGGERKLEGGSKLQNLALASYRQKVAGNLGASGQLQQPGQNGDRLSESPAKQPADDNEQTPLAGQQQAGKKSFDNLDLNSNTTNSQLNSSQKSEPDQAKEGQRPSQGDNQVNRPPSSTGHHHSHNQNRLHHQHRHHHHRHDGDVAVVDASQLAGGGGGLKKRSTDKGQGGQQLEQSGAELQVALQGNSSAAGQAGRSGANVNANRAYLASDNERHKRKLAKARERRATLILGLIMAAFICSWLPFFTFYVLRALCHVCRDYVSSRFEAFIFWMGYCNSAINPIIYTIFNRDFRRAFRKILFKCL